MSHHGDEAREWDEVYTEDGDVPRWSGQPNGALVAEAADLDPGSALDVGCGEGGDVIWLAGRGWIVTALDPSSVALDRARAAAGAVGNGIAWVHAGLLGMPAWIGPHDLVSAQYPALRRTEDDAAITALLDAVAPGGTLLVVHHLFDPDNADDCRPDHVHAHHPEHDQPDDDHRFDPHDYVMPGDVLARLDDGWEVEVHEVRPRAGDLPADARHVDDIVLRARRAVVAGR